MIKKLLILFICFLIGYQPVHAASINQYGHFKKGKTAYQKKAYDDAQKSFLKNLDSKKHIGEANYNLGNIYYQKKEYENAKKAYSVALDHLTDAQKKATTFFNLGNTAYQAKQFENAAQYYENALSLRPSDRQAKHNLELALRKMKQNPNKKPPQKKPKKKKPPKQKPKPKPPQPQPKPKPKKPKPPPKIKQKKIQRRNAKRILDRLKQKERDARRKLWKKKHFDETEVEFDW